MSFCGRTAAFGLVVRSAKQHFIGSNGAAGCRRTLVATSKSPGSDPLAILKAECVARNLCNEHGCHIPRAHWVASLSTTSATTTNGTRSPHLHSIGIARVSRAGLDFVVKRGSRTSENILSGGLVALLHQQGRFLPGESAEQWRAEGICEPLRLDNEILECVPISTLTSMVASSRVAAEQKQQRQKSASSVGVSDGRVAMLSKSHLTELMHKAQFELKQGEVPLEVLEESIAAFRFQPDRMECMLGGPDTVMWDRWEWIRDATADSSLIPAGTLAWAQPMHLVPH